MGRAKKDAMGMGDSGKWMQSDSIKKGGLHKSLGIPSDKKIPAKVLNKATHSQNPKIRKEADLAKTFKKFRPQGR